MTPFRLLFGRILSLFRSDRAEAELAREIEACRSPCRGGTREIGIRVALGSDRGRIVAAIFRWPLAQVALGIASGGILVVVLTHLITGLSAKEASMVAAYMALMMAVCMLACIVPTRRALAIEPSEALRAE